MTTRIIETWLHKGFWLGTEHDQSTAQITLQNSVRAWKATNGEETIVLVSRDWNFTQEAAINFRQMLKTGQYQTHKIGFDDWNEVGKKWQQKAKKK